MVPRGRFVENGQYSRGPLTNPIVPAHNVADFLQGVFQGVEFQFGTPTANLRQNYIAAYVQDSWRVNSKLTVNLGMRWEYQSPWTDKYDSIVNIDFKWDHSQFPAFVRAGTGDPFENNPLYRLPASFPYSRDGRFGRGTNRPDRNNWAPRVGLAYSVNSKTVIRTGAGLFYVNEIGSSYFDLVRNPPFSVRLNETATNAIRPNLTWANPHSPLNNIPSFSLALQWSDPTSTVGQWSLGVQRQLTNDMSLEATYIGTSGMYLKRLTNYNTPRVAPGGTNANRSFPIFLGATQVQGGSAHSTYHSLQIKLQQRLSRGFTMLNSFSYGKSIDDSSSVRNAAGDGAPTDPDNIRGTGRGLSSFDFRKRFTTSMLYELPFGRGKKYGSGMNAALNAVVGGWQLGGIATLQDGNPFTVTCASGATQNNGGTACRPDVVFGQDPNLPRGQQDPMRFFNTDAFINRTAGGAQFRYGTAGRNTVPGPGLINIDFSVTKNFYFAERRYVEFRAEFFNISNHPMFRAPNASPGGAGYGRLNTTSVDSRQLQFGLKFVF